MHPADTIAIDEVLAAYHSCYPTQYAFYDDVDGVIGDHEEAILRAQMEGSPLCELMKDALSADTPPEEISAEAFYGDMYFWPKRTLVFCREKTTKRPMPYYQAATNKAFKPEDYKLLEAYWASLKQDEDNTSDRRKPRSFNISTASIIRADAIQLWVGKAHWPSNKRPLK